MNRIKLKTRKELASDLDISVSTLSRWINRENLTLPKGRYLKPSEYKEILSLFGVSDEE